MAVGVAVSVSKVAVYSRMTEVNSFYARVVADGGTISDFSALRLAVLDYKAVQSLEPSLYTFASGRKAGTQYSLVPTDGSGDLSVTRSGDTAMELNANGFWQPVAANLPRYDYVGGVPMINIEELRTNLLPRYKTFAHSDWAKSGARIEGDPTTAGADIIAGWNLTNWNKVGGSVTTTANTFVIGNTSTDFGITKQILTVGKYYKVTIAGTSQADFSVRQSDSGGLSSITVNSGFGTFYFFAERQHLYLRTNTLGTTTIATLTVQEVTGYASPFVDSAGANLMSGYKLVEDTSNGKHQINSQLISFTSGISYVISLRAKKDTRSYIAIEGQSAYFGNNQCVVNLNTGVAIVQMNGVAKVSQSADGYYTIEWRITATSDGNGVVYILMHSGTSATYLGDGTSGILIAHAQLEAGATASSPIGGDEGSAQTRNADVIVKTGASALIGQTEGYAVVEVNISKLLGAVTRGIFTLGAAISSDNRIFVGYSSIFTNRIRFFIDASGSRVVDFNKEITTFGRHLVGIAWKNNDSVMYIDGVTTTLSTNGAISFNETLDKISTGSLNNGTSFFNDQIKLVHLGKTRISNAQLQALTTL